MWCILAALFPATDERKTGKVSDYEEHLGKIDLRGISFPTPQLYRFLVRLEMLSCDLNSISGRVYLDIRLRNPT